MHELIDILLDIKNELTQMNEKLDNISGYYSISDVCDKIDDPRGISNLETVKKSL